MEAAGIAARLVHEPHSLFIEATEIEETTSLKAIAKDLPQSLGQPFTWSLTSGMGEATSMLVRFPRSGFGALANEV